MRYGTYIDGLATLEGLKIEMAANGVGDGPSVDIVIDV